MVIETVTASNLTYGIYLLGSLFAVFCLLFTVYYAEYVKQKRFIKFHNLEAKYEEFTRKTKVN
jgi:hypothetical protein